MDFDDSLEAAEGGLGSSPIHCSFPMSKVAGSDPSWRGRVDFSLVAIPRNKTELIHPALVVPAEQPPACQMWWEGYQKKFGSSLLSRVTKIRLCKTLKRPVPMCGSETWVLSRGDEPELYIFERKLLRIHGPIKENAHGEGEQIMRFTAYKPDVMKMIRLGRLRWAGYVARIDAAENPKKFFDEKLLGSRQGMP